MLIEIRVNAQAGQFELSRHAVDQTILRGVSVRELREALGNSEIIEDYPEDRYGPSCLLLGFTRRGRPLHAQCSYPSRPILKIITVYEPDATQWVDLRVRRADQ